MTTVNHVTVGSVVGKIKSKTYEKIVWYADRCHEFVERLEDLIIDERLTELLGKENIDRRCRCIYCFKV